jgi:hypothetical protein
MSEQFSKPEAFNSNYRLKDMGCIVGEPEGIEKENGITWVEFGGVPGEASTLPIKTQDLLDGGVNPDDPDPLAGNRVWFWAEVNLGAETREEVNPLHFEVVPKVTLEDVAAWESGS